MSKTTESVHVASQTVAAKPTSAEAPLDCLKVEMFRHYGHYDPAGLCDGGDFHHIMQIRMEKTRDGGYEIGEDGFPRVFLHFQSLERGEAYQGEISYKQFWDVFAKAFKPVLKKV